MKHRLGWRQASRNELAEHLRTARVLDSEAVGEASVYRCQGADGECVVIALPGDTGLIIDIQAAIPAALERRRGSDDSAPATE